MRRLDPTISSTLSTLVVAISLQSCVTRSVRTGSLPEVAGGQNIAETTYPAVVEITSEFTDSDAESCTATAITPQVFLTAGHCVWKQLGNPSSTPQKEISGFDFDPGAPFDDLLNASRQRPNPFADDIEEATKFPGSRRVSLRATPYSTACYVIPSGWALESGGPGSRFDIALVAFEKPIAQNLMAIDDAVKTTGAPVTFVGYGWKTEMNKDSHIKREGRNVIADISSEGIIYSYSPAAKKDLGQDEAMVREGDSGGPLVMNGKLAGVATALLYAKERRVCLDISGKKVPCENKLVDIGYHVDLSNAAVKKFVSESLAALAKGPLDPSKPDSPCSPREKQAFLKKMRASKPASGT